MVHLFKNNHVTFQRNSNWNSMCFVFHMPIFLFNNIFLLKVFNIFTFSRYTNTSNRDFIDRPKCCWAYRTIWRSTCGRWVAYLSKCTPASHYSVVPTNKIKWIRSSKCWVCRRNNCSIKRIKRRNSSISCLATGGKKDKGNNTIIYIYTLHYICVCRILRYIALTVMYRNKKEVVQHWTFWKNYVN